MKKLIPILLALSISNSNCTEKIIEEEPNCWKCQTMYQKTDEVLKELYFCDKTWQQIITIADSLNTPGLTYTSCTTKYNK